MFNVMILPILSYGCQVWGSSYLNNLKQNNLYHICEKNGDRKSSFKIYEIHFRSTLQIC